MERCQLERQDIRCFDAWAAIFAKRILNEYNLIIYPRQGYPIEKNNTTKKNITFSKAPIIEISSTFIRDGLKHGKNMNYFIPANVYNYIIKNKLYL